ncbi:MAG: S41 family peptidase [Verrucomicrobiota bacterium]
MKNIGKGSIGLMAMVLMIANLIVGAKLYNSEEALAERVQAFSQLELFTKVVEHVREYYVDGEKVDYDSLIIDGALNGMLESLDPHSQFMDKDMYDDMKEDTTGQFGGIGIVISVEDGILTVVAPMEGTPGFDAGIRTDDRIIEIDGASTEGFALSEAVKRLRGVPGSHVTMKVLRPENSDVMDFSITRSVINVASVKDANVNEDGIGYIRIISFDQRSADLLQKGLEDMIDQGMKGLVLDLRNNPGGLLTAAIEVSQKFLDKKDPVVFTQGRDFASRKTYRARGAHHYKDFPLVILINSGSASASEIVAGALQDHKRAILVGQRSFGKGSVQSVLPMDGGSAIRLTTARYYTPSERVIHKRGIMPDIVVDIDPVDWQRILQRRTRPYSSTGEESQDVEDPQLDRAIDVLKGIMLFQARKQDQLKQMVQRRSATSEL